MPKNIDKNNDVADSINIRKDSLAIKKDTIIPKEQLDDVAKMKAEGKITSSITNKQTTLHKKSSDHLSGYADRCRLH